MQSPKIDFSAAVGKGDALLLGWFQGEKGTKPESKGEEKSASPQYLGKPGRDIEALLSRLKESKHFSGKKNETDILRYYEMGGSPNVMLVGLGAAKRCDGEVLRQAGAAAYLAQKRGKLSHVVAAADSIFAKVTENEVPRAVQAFCEGYLLAGHEFHELKKPAREKFAPEGLTLGGLKGADVESAAKRAKAVAAAVNRARVMGDRPGNFLTPDDLAQEASRMAKEHGIRCKIFGKKELEKEKMGLLLGVGQGSQHESRFVVLEYQGGKKGEKPIALVGKGVTFDSGGISLKPAGQMEDMKYDMMGAATVIGVFQAAASLKLPVNLMGFIAAAENMPGGRAQKPGDVVRSLSGKTVEITNTDAEGRLILADALEYAQKQHPQAIIDFATLTGAVVVALGTVTTGIMGTSPELIDRMKASARETGERVWELPLYEEYEEDLKSHYADIKNSGVRDAGSSKGGIFLKFFIDEKYPWVHCDIAGTAYHRKDVNYHPSKYASGAMIRLITNLFEHWTPLK